MEKTFVTLFPPAQNVHLTKDIGLIPYYFYKMYGYKSYIATMSFEKDFPNLKLLDGLNISHIVRSECLLFKKYYKWKYGDQYLEYLSCKKYLEENSKRIDVLQLYHVHDMYVGEYAKIYKKYNPDGVLYLKLDLGDKTYSWLKKVFYKKECSKKESSRVDNLIHYSDIVSVESTKFVPELKGIFGEKVFYLPCGCFEIGDNHKELNWGEKSNIFLSVGNLSEWKGTHLLLDAFVSIADKCDWKLMLVGPVFPPIDEKIRRVLYDNPKLKQRIIIKGNINDREELYSQYKNSKVFVLPSKGESFGIVFLEAKYNGCFIILTDTVAPKDDLIRNDNDGRIISYDKVDILADSMLEMTKLDIYNKKNYDYIRDDYYNRFSYSETLLPILHRINELIRENKEKN